MTTTAGPSSTSSSDVNADVTKAYLAYWDMYFRVNDPPNPDDPQITELTTGPALPALLDIIHTNASQGLVFRLPANGVGKHTVKVLSVDGTTATLQDCSVDDGQVIRASSGEVVNGDVVTKLINATLTNDSGQWKVSQYDFVQRTPGVAECGA